MNYEWQTAEINGYVHYAKQGYRILVSLVRTEGYDFVIEKNGRFQRVNVKKAYKKTQRPNAAYAITLSRSLQKPAKEMNTPDFIKLLRKRCDLYLIWLPDHNKFIETTPDFLAFSSCNNARIPPELVGDPNQQVQFRAPHSLEQQTLAKDGLKRCNFCKKVKSLDDFPQVWSHGHRTTAPNCRPCHSLYYKKIRNRAKNKRPNEAPPPQRAKRDNTC